ncbi:DUF5420 family protein [Methylomonas sp. EFPC3]|uniref:DUF5420 family protein n=1 Tax=Methylomonas sp. EFPC3 TaxID=3021710 RepID=UPI002417A1F6|nr:DUF5420 family protein [Methylomonas sp. EFPC3]WFP48541.1 DUF5420 family protein [Methylomonas sp. EFPC3]
MPEIKYFIAEGEKADRVANQGLEFANQKRKDRQEYLTEMGADAFYERERSAPTGLAFAGADGSEKKGFKKPFQVEHESHKYWVYQPNRQTTIGKQISARLKKLATFNFSNYAVTEFSVNVHKFDAGRLYFSVAGFYKSTLVFKIPFGDDPVTIPPDFREIKKSEFIALTEE